MYSGCSGVENLFWAVKESKFCYNVSMLQSMVMNNN